METAVFITLAAVFFLTAVVVFPFLAALVAALAFAVLLEELVVIGALFTVSCEAFMVA